jgi:hypothetical protein
MNRDSVLSMYSDARAEYTKQLSVFLVPAYFRFYVDLLAKAKQVMAHEPKRVLWQFQNFLNEIHDWNTEKVNNEIHIIQTNSGCDYLEDLLTAVFIAHTKVLTAIRLSTNTKKIDIKIPTVDHFLFKVLCETSKLLWSSTYLFHEGLPGIEKQQNYRTIEGILHEGILQAVRSLVPVKSILKDFVNMDVTANNDASKDDDSDDDVEMSSSNDIQPPTAPTQFSEPHVHEMAEPVTEPVTEPILHTPSAEIPSIVAPPAPLEIPVESDVSTTTPSQPTTPVIVLDNKPTVRFGEFDAMFDSDHPHDSDMIFEPKDGEDTKHEMESGPVLHILDEEPFPMDDDVVDPMDMFDLPAESLAEGDYEQL